MKECIHKTEKGYCTVFERGCDANTCNPYCCEYEPIQKKKEGTKCLERNR